MTFRFPAFLSRPSTEPEILDKLELYRLQPDLYCKSFTNILDNRNGLLLYQDLRGMHVANPAVQRRAQLPPPPRFESGFSNVGHLLFDPTESPHYEVVLVPVDRKTDEIDKESRQQPMDESEEWPPSIWVLCVFSSRTGQWEERAFVQESESARITCHKDFPSLQRASSAYWRGAFFVLCNNGSHALKLSLSNNAYRLIELPADIGDKEPYLGRSKEGVCCAAFHHWISGKLQIWILVESCGKTEWLLKNHVDLEHSVSRLMHLCREIEGPWVLQDANNVKTLGSMLTSMKVTTMHF